MNNFKNLLIAVLTGLLALSLFSQPAQSATTGNTAKAIQYDNCLIRALPDFDISLDAYTDRAATDLSIFINHIDFVIKACSKYRP